MTSDTGNAVAAAIENAEDIGRDAGPSLDEDMALERATDAAIDTEHGASPKDSQATSMVRLVRASGSDLWHTPAGDGYISILVTDHHEHYPLNGRACKDYLSRLYYRDTGKAPSASALQDAMATLSGIARFDGVERQAHVRVASEDRRIYLDLCDSQWRAVEICDIGWQVVTNPPVRFRRPRGLLPLPMPEPGGSIAELRPFMNVETDDDFVLLVMWLLASLRACGPYPILVVMAEQGSAKTTTTRVLRQLVDPNESDVRRPPRNTEDLMIAATNGHVVAFDNLSRLPDDLSDNLSVLATGGGFAVRQLYRNAEEHIFQAQRPIILNGISQVATRGDLLDRAIVVTLPPIGEERRKDEATFWREFETARPRILGALLDAVSVGLRRVGGVHLARKPRMADFALWGVAVEVACPWPKGMFLRVYTGNRQGALEATLEGDPVVDVVRALVEKAPHQWQGTATDLLAELNQRTPEAVKRLKDWFSRPRQISDALRRFAPSLRKTGIDVALPGKRHREPGTGRRVITLVRTEPVKTDQAASHSSHASDSQGVVCDASRDGDLDASQGSSRPEVGIPGLRDACDARDAQRPLPSGDAGGDRLEVPVR